MPEKHCGIHLDLDGAWDSDILEIECLDLRRWGPRLRYFARIDDLEAFCREIAGHLASFVLYGSGDFHHLAAIFVRRVSNPVTLISFDNHPDWDIRPPRWSCGGWINRALDNQNIERAIVWGCGNFELGYPSYLFANRRALRSGRLQVHAWAERQAPRVRRRFDCMSRDNWRQRFADFAQSVAGGRTYVTIDLDCLRAEEAAVNWESGLFTAADLVWALGQLKRCSTVVGGDICGAYSVPRYARWTQRLAGFWDHPRLAPVAQTDCRRRNCATLELLWPALAGSKV